MATLDGHFPLIPYLAAFDISRCHGCRYTFFLVVFGQEERVGGEGTGSRSATSRRLKKSAMTSRWQRVQEPFPKKQHVQYIKHMAFANCRCRASELLNLESMKFPMFSLAITCQVVVIYNFT